MGCLATFLLLANSLLLSLRKALVKVKRKANSGFSGDGENNDCLDMG
ncbi:hypothetical protein HT094_01500 [Shewanella sp. ZOR0012]|nr:hypothetical protein [Shewanella sp. ZOR0012]NSM23117.1 hypothetical protein [Shewanella sp. ZOR0012]